MGVDKTGAPPQTDHATPRTGSTSNGPQTVQDGRTAKRADPSAADHKSERLAGSPPNSTPQTANPSSPSLSVPGFGTWGWTERIDVPVGYSNVESFVGTEYTDMQAGRDIAIDIKLVRFIDPRPSGGLKPSNVFFRAFYNTSKFEFSAVIPGPGLIVASKQLDDEAVTVALSVSGGEASFSARVLARLVFRAITPGFSTFRLEDVTIQDSGGFNFPVGRPSRLSMGIAAHH